MQETKPALKILSASAGSGKTFALTVHFLGLLLWQPGSYREILALTFTNKATAEMKARILGVLGALAGGDMDSQTVAYRNALQNVFPDMDSEKIRERADEAYRRILHDYSRFSVMTIDGFSQQVVRNFTYELGLDSAFRIELNTDKVRKDLMDRLYKQLNEHQELFEWVIRRILKRIEEDKPWDINRELYDLSRIMFTDDFKLLEDVVSRRGNEQLFGTVSEYNRVWMETYTSAYQERMGRMIGVVNQFWGSRLTEEDLFGKGRNFIYKLWKEQKQYLDKPQNLDMEKLVTGLNRLADNADAYQTAKKRNAEVEELYRKFNPEILGMMDFLLERQPQYHLVTAVDANVHYLRLLKDMADLLADWRTENNAQLISDAQTLLARIGRTAQGDPTFIWEKIGTRYQYFLFDEFQDTSHAQWDNLLPLLINALGNAAQDRRTHRHLIVGDVKQSIYRWRNGDFRILLQGVEQEIARAFHLRDTRQLIMKETLDVNYRSEKNIIDFNNHLFSNLPARLQDLINAQVQAVMSDEDYQRHWVDTALQDTIVRAYEGSWQEVPQEKLAAASGTVRIAFVPQDKEQTDPVEEICRRTYDKVADWITEGQYRPGDIGILVRTNHEARLLIEYFTQGYLHRGKSVHAVGGEESDLANQLEIPVIAGDALLLGGHDSVRAIVAALRLMAYESREYNAYLAALVFHYATAKKIKIEEQTWFAIGKMDMAALGGLLPQELLKTWDGLKRLPLAELVERLIGYLRFDEDPRAVPYLLALRDAVGAFVQNGNRGLQGFLEYWDEEGQELPLPGAVQQDAVEILTIHKSKGLAYQAVMIPFCSWKLDGNARGQVWFDMEGTDYAAFERMPLAYGRNVRQSVLFAQYYQEQLYNYMDALNALYVAATRAKKDLWLLAPDPLDGKDRALPSDLNIQDVGTLLFSLLIDLPGPARIESEEPFCLSILPEQAGQEETRDFAPDPPEGKSESLRLRGYPVSTLLSSLLSRQDQVDQEIRRKKKMSALFSNALHLLMADVSAAPELDTRIAYLTTQGQLNPEEGKQAREIILRAWGHPLLGSWLKAGDYQQISEQGILDAQGNTWRPDKIFLGERETIVVDFKLAQADSGQDHAARVAQLENYTGLLQQLSLPSVRGYLYYFMENELVQVTGMKF